MRVPGPPWPAKASLGSTPRLNSTAGARRNSMASASVPAVLNTAVLPAMVFSML